MFFLTLIFLIINFNIIFQVIISFNLFNLISNFILSFNYHIFIILLLSIYLYSFNFIIILPQNIKILHKFY